MEDIFIKKDNFKELEDVKSVLKYGDACNVQNPVVSILMPVYKRPDTFGESLNSALNQDFVQPYEVVVVDNYDGEGESPNLAIVKQTGAKNIMYYQNEKNLGMYGNWNRGIELARAPFVTYCHDDDVLLPTCLNRLMYLQKKTGNKCILSRYNIINEDGHYIVKYKYPHKFMHLFKEKDYCEYTLYDQFLASVGFGVGCLFNRQNLLQLGGYNKSFYPSADYALQSSYTYHYGCVINNIPTFNYRIGKNESLSNYNMFSKMDIHIRMCIMKNLKYPQWWLKRIMLANYRTRKIGFDVIWGGKDNSHYKKTKIRDKIIMKIASVVHVFNGYYLF